MARRSSNGARRAFMALGVAAVIAACGPVNAPLQHPAGAPPTLTIAPADGASAVRLDQPITVTASAAINSVTVTENGVKASLSPAPASSGNTWRYTGGLDLNKTYRVTATASNGGGTATAVTTFTTIPTAARLLSSVQWISQGQTVGVGMPIDVQFNTPIPAQQQAGIIAHIAVVSHPSQPGGWVWADPQDVHYRPQNWWQPGTNVTVDAQLNGVDAGDGYWGLGNWTEDFSVGAEQVTLVNTQARTFQTYNGDPAHGGTLTNNWSANTGKPGFETLNGMLVVLYHTPVVDMKSCTTFHTSAACTPGGANYYDENVYNDTAVSTDGYYIHAAPWVCGTDLPVCDAPPYGKVNSSHGCINLSTNNAVAYYNSSQVGDIVEVSGSPNEASFADGEGDWQTPWSSFAPGGQDVTLPSGGGSPSPSPAG